MLGVAQAAYCSAPDGIPEQINLQVRLAAVTVAHMDASFTGSAHGARAYHRMLIRCYADVLIR